MAAFLPLSRLGPVAQIAFGIIPSFREALASIFPPLVLIGTKTSHRNKRQRSQGKQLKQKTNLVVCQSCGRPKLMHNLCPYCYSFVTRSFKAATRAGLPTPTVGDDGFLIEQAAPPAKNSPAWRKADLEAKKKLWKAQDDAEQLRKESYKPRAPAEEKGVFRRLWDRI